MKSKPTKSPTKSKAAGKRKAKVAKAKPKIGPARLPMMKLADKKQLDLKKLEGQLPNVRGPYRKMLMARIHFEKKRRKSERRRERHEAEARGEPVERQVPMTVETMREPDETMVEPGDVEVTESTIVDEFAPHFGGRAVPKLLVTTGKNPSKKLIGLLKEIVLVIPGCIYYRVSLTREQRTHAVLQRLKYEMKSIVESAKKANFTDVLVFTEKHKKPYGLYISHLPEGPTSFFRFSGLTLAQDIHGGANMTTHRPELILKNFSTRLGVRIGRQLEALFPVGPEFKGRRVVAFHNQRDFIFFRHYRYIFDETGEKATLQEIGPRFTLKLRFLQEGTFDTESGKFEYLWRPDIWDTIATNTITLVGPNVTNTFMDQSIFITSIGAHELENLQAKLAQVDNTRDDARTMCTADVISTAVNGRQLGALSKNARASIRQSQEWDEKIRQVRKSLYDTKNVAKLFPFYKVASTMSTNVAIIHVRSLTLPHHTATELSFALQNQLTVPVFISLITSEGVALLAKFDVHLLEGSHRKTAPHGSVFLTPADFAHRHTSCTTISLPLNARWALPVMNPQPLVDRTHGTFRVALEVKILNRCFADRSVYVTGPMRLRTTSNSTLDNRPSNPRLNRSSRLMFETYKLVDNSEHSVLLAMRAAEIVADHLVIEAGLSDFGTSRSIKSKLRDLFTVKRTPNETITFGSAQSTARLDCLSHTGTHGDPLLPRGGSLLFDFCRSSSPTVWTKGRSWMAVKTSKVQELFAQHKDSNVLLLRAA